MATTSEPAEVRDTQDGAGAERGEVAPGVEGVLGYGDLAAEHRALTEGCAAVDRSWAGRLEMLGEDRGRFLQGLVTCDVEAVSPGGGTYGFVTSRKGQVIADVRVLALEDRLWLELPAGRAEAVAEHLAAFKIADRVEIAPLERVPLTVAGPRAAAVVAAAEGAELSAPAAARAVSGESATAAETETASGGAERSAPPWSHRAGSVGGEDVRVVRRGLVGVEAFDLWVAPEGAERVWEALVAAGAVPAGFRALETLRVERGIPRWGAEFGPETLPQETGLEEAAVSFTKGCYLGQEVVARIHYRGGVNRRLVALRFPAGSEPPAAGATLLADGRPAGTVGSALRAPAAGRPLGLAIVHQRAAEPGTRLEVAGGGEAEVAEVPR